MSDATELDLLIRAADAAGFAMANVEADDVVAVQVPRTPPASVSPAPSISLLTIKNFASSANAMRESVTKASLAMFA